MGSRIFLAKSALWWTKFQNAGLFFLQLGPKNGIFSIIQSYFFGKKRPLVDKISKRRLIFFAIGTKKWHFQYNPVVFFWQKAPSGGQNFKTQAYFFCNWDQKMAFSA